MKKIKFLFISIVILLISNCASTQNHEEGGIGGTGHADQCNERKGECHVK